MLTVSQFVVLFYPFKYFSFDFALSDSKPIFVVCCIYFKENSGAKSTFGLIKHRYLVNRSLRFVFTIIECKKFYL